MGLLESFNPTLLSNSLKKLLCVKALQQYDWHMTSVDVPIIIVIIDAFLSLRPSQHVEPGNWQANERKL